MHVRRMDKGRIPKDLLYGQLDCGTCAIGRPCLRYKDSCKTDIRSIRINFDTWEAQHQSALPEAYAVRSEVSGTEEDGGEHLALRRQKRSASIPRDDLHLRRLYGKLPCTLGYGGTVTVDSVLQQSVETL